MDLFEHANRERQKKHTPLAARMRPRTLDEFMGQNAIVGPGRLLRRAIQADQLSSLLLYGPPGTGKTTLAQIIANSTQAHFVALNAVLAGVKDIRAAVQEASLRRKDLAQRTILFVDEVHRFNKSQQDALLPWVENGTVIFVGATTENPYFEVNKALVSRSRIFQLQSLDDDALRAIVAQALTDTERGYGHRSVVLSDDALDHLVNVANGDARTLLNALELAVETTAPDDEGRIHVELEVAEESIQRRALLYDKEGDAHFDTISAFIKSLRGSDPDAALYWLARMVYAGEDPKFLFRRMLIAASEDIGLADPNAIVVVEACAATFDRIGMPEGQFPLAQAALYLATAPKSNSAMGFFDALASVKQTREDDVPTHLKDASRDKESSGHGKGYLYPHAYRDHWVAQQYLPNNMQGQVFYQPSSQGYEGSLQQQVSRRREAQLAALEEGTFAAPPEILTFGPSDPKQERWLQRTQSQIGERLGQIRDRLFALATPQRHHVLLDLRGEHGLLTWEALRLVPEGGVYSRVADDHAASQMLEQAAMLPELSRPIPVTTPLPDLTATLQSEHPELRFDRIVGYNCFYALPNQDALDDKAAALTAWTKWLAPHGSLLLAETIPRHTQRLYAFLSPDWLPPETFSRLRDAEEAIYQDPNTPRLQWDTDDLRDALTHFPLPTEWHQEQQTTAMQLSPAMIQRWFPDRPSPTSYSSRLQATLTPDEIVRTRRLFEQRLAGQTVSWSTTTLFLQITASP